jgi:capsular polysaccharide biosynthesis protein
MLELTSLLTGPHGAGLANMLFSNPDVSVIEFSMKPHCNRCFGYMAMSLEVDYWLVPQMYANYHLNYNPTPDAIEATVRVLKHVILQKGLTNLLISKKSDL